MVACLKNGKNYPCLLARSLFTFWILAHEESDTINHRDKLVNNKSLNLSPISACARAFARVRARVVVKPYPSGPIPDVLARPYVGAPFICCNLHGVLIILLGAGRLSCIRI